MVNKKENKIQGIKNRRGWKSAEIIGRKHKERNTNS